MTVVTGAEAMSLQVLCRYRCRDCRYRCCGCVVTGAMTVVTGAVAVSLQVFAGREPPCVEFLPVSVWLIGADCVAKYRVDSALEVSGWDWIALFRVRR